LSVVRAVHEPTRSEREGEPSGGAAARSVSRLWADELGKADEGKSGREDKSAAHLPRFLFLEEISAQGAGKLL
jgi:hypothetical protein